MRLKPEWSITQTQPGNHKTHKPITTWGKKRIQMVSSAGFAIVVVWLFKDEKTHLDGGKVWKKDYFYQNIFYKGKG